MFQCCHPRNQGAECDNDNDNDSANGLFAGIAHKQAATSKSTGTFTVTDELSLSTTASPVISSPPRGVPRNVTFEATSVVIAEEADDCMESKVGTTTTTTTAKIPADMKRKKGMLIRGIFLVGILVLAVILPFVDVKKMAAMPVSPARTEGGSLLREGAANQVLVGNRRVPLCDFHRLIFQRVGRRKLPRNCDCE